MTNDPTIREQSYHYFLQEAPELLGVLEQDLLSLREDYSINKVHNLMRTTHTLKGAAASVGLETIKTVAHSLEDIFKALFNPELSIDPEIEALLFEGYECLRLPLTAELTGGKVNDAEVLDRSAVIFAQLQEKLGDCFGEEAQIPSSVELGFDVTQSIFEIGVTQRLEEIAAALSSGEPAIVATTLQTQAEVFLGLGQSLNLPGFGAIAQAVLMALDAYPEQAVTIAQIALEDFQSGQAVVLEGDRSLGGQPSLALQQLAQLSKVGEKERGKGGERIVFQHLDQTDYSLSQVSQAESATQPEFMGISSTADTELSEDDLEEDNEIEEFTNRLLEEMWGVPAEIDSYTLGEQENEEEFSPIPPLSDEPEVTVETPPFQFPQADKAPTASPRKDPISASRTVRVNVEHLERLNYSVGELLTNQNRQSLQNEQLRTAVKALLDRVDQQQQLLHQLQDVSDSRFIDVEKWRLRESGRFERRKEIAPRTTSRYANDSGLHPTALTSRPPLSFDSLELDRYSESQILVQSLLEDSVQLAEAAEAIELFTTESNQTLDKQRRLLTSTRDALMEARMLPLKEIFGRFPRVLQQLEILHNKPITLQLHGTEVLVDKVVVEKLYEPLLHLVRNAFDHGIESPKLRLEWGKPEKGQIEISAHSQGRHLLIEVRDDGQGLDFEKIRQRAVERRFLEPEQARRLNEEQLTDLLFEPGFSTASGVNDLSGRGIGLDVVRTQMQALHGSVMVHSKMHQGTTFTLQIPLSQTIAKLLLFQVSDRSYALLADAIEQILIPQADQIRSWDDGKVLRWGKGASEQLVPIYQLAKVLKYDTRFGEPFVSKPEQPFVPEGQMLPVILIHYQDTLLGLEVDQLIGEQELVIRPLGAMIAPPSYIYGGSILADGRLTLVLDGTQLMQYVFDRQTPASSDQTSTSVATPLLPSNPQPSRLLPAASPTALPAPPEQNFRARPNKMILLVDDSITVRQALALTLQKAGFQVVQAKDGYEAIEQLQYQKDIQLVLCDIEMPRMNGFEFLKHRQQDSVLASIPVVILTSRSGEKHRLIATELGATAYITKPYLEHQLLATVTNVLEKSSLNSVSQ
jgi:chemotaxis protein histidine kinase CheA/CheY-like chemotaxis protein